MDLSGIYGSAGSDGERLKVWKSLITVIFMYTRVLNYIFFGIYRCLIGSHRPRALIQCSSVLLLDGDSEDLIGKYFNRVWFHNPWRPVVHFWRASYFAQTFSDGSYRLVLRA